MGQRKQPRIRSFLDACFLALIWAPAIIVGAPMVRSYRVSVLGWDVSGELVGTLVALPSAACFFLFIALSGDAETEAPGAYAIASAIIPTLWGALVYFVTST
jgi:hypothetical protein